MNTSHPPVFSDQLDVPFTADKLSYSLLPVVNRECRTGGGSFRFLCDNKQIRVYIRLERIGTQLVFYGEPYGERPYDFEFCRGVLCHRAGKISGHVSFFGFNRIRAG